MAGTIEREERENAIPAPHVSPPRFETPSHQPTRRPPTRSLHCYLAPSQRKRKLLNPTRSYKQPFPRRRTHRDRAYKALITRSRVLSGVSPPVSCREICRAKKDSLDCAIAVCPSPLHPRCPVCLTVDTRLTARQKSHSADLTPPGSYSLLLPRGAMSLIRNKMRGKNHALLLSLPPPRPKALSLSFSSFL